MIAQSEATQSNVTWARTDAPRHPTAPVHASSVATAPAAVLDAEWSAARRSILLFGSAALVMPTALTLLLLAVLLPLDADSFAALLISASVLFYAVVELAWRGQARLPKGLLRRLPERLASTPHLSSAASRTVAVQS
jgi:hypothetical protein